MPIKDKEIVALVDEQTKLFLDGAPVDKKVDVLKRIVKRQKQLMRNKDD